MARSPDTRHSLLVRLRDPADRLAWSEFVEIYGPLIYSYGRRRGLQDADASDLVQEVLRALAAASGASAYDPARGSFRAWLFAITRNQCNRSMRRGSTQLSGQGGTTHLELLGTHADTPDDELWERDHRNRLFIWAADLAKKAVLPKTWEAFARSFIEDRPIDDVARELDMTPGAVYIARSRVLARIRDTIERIEGDSTPRQPQATRPGRKP